MGSVAENLQDVRNRIQAAAGRAGRDPTSVSLVCVSKTQPVSAICEAREAGAVIFGENYAQELRNKAAELEGLGIEWHFIGHLQKNKAKYVASSASCVETVDSLEIAETLDRRATKKIRCLIEVNIGGEGSKSGVDPASVQELVRGIASLEKLEPVGLMIIPPYDTEVEKSRPHFRKLAELLKETNRALAPLELAELSMGMSHDFEVAIEEGATIVRVGTAIFGERNQ